VQVASNAEGRARGLKGVSFHVQARTWHMKEMTLSFEDATFRINEEEFSVLNQTT